MRIALVSRSQTTRDVVREAARAAQEDVCCTFSEVTSALARFREDPPDLLLLEVGEVEGGAPRATRRLLEVARCPVLLVARAGEEGIDEVTRALAEGAADVAVLPNATSGSREAEILAIAAKVRTMRRLSRPQRVEAETAAPARAGTLIAIGASTGGPHALAVVLRTLAKPCQAAILAAIHIDKVFVPDLVRWLGSTCGIPVGVAQPGQAPQRGEVLLAASDDHLVLRAGGALDYTHDPIDAPHRPSVDVFFESLAASRSVGVAVLLTGMGRDGARGLLRLRARGWSTIAQDEATSTVYGMPKAAAELGAAEAVLALERIGPAIDKALGALARSRHASA